MSRFSKASDWFWGHTKTGCAIITVIVFIISYVIVYGGIKVPAELVCNFNSVGNDTILTYKAKCADYLINKNPELYLEDIRTPSFGVDTFILKNKSVL